MRDIDSALSNRIGDVAQLIAIAWILNYTNCCGVNYEKRTASMTSTEKRKRKNVYNKESLKKNASTEKSFKS